MENKERVAWVHAPHDAVATPWPWPLGLLAGFVAGVALQLQQAMLLATGAYVAGAALGMVGLVGLAWRGRGHRMALWAAVLAGLLLGGGTAGWRAAAIEARALDPQLEGVDLRVIGVIAEMPQHTDSGLRLRVAVTSAQRVADQAGASVTLPPLLSIGWYAARTEDDGPEPLPDVRAGDIWHMTLKLKAPHGSANPHGFDYELWTWEQGIGATGYVRTVASVAQPQRLAPSWRHPVERARQATRDAIFARVADARQAGVVAALVTGDQAAIERVDWTVFRTTGVAHLMSISGLHVTMFAWLAAWLAGAVWRRSTRLMLWRPAPQAALVLGVVFAALYALFSGWGVPAQRTVCMLAVVGGLRIAGLRWPWPCVWLLACAAVVAIDPWALLQPGFWLSFVAVGVLFATGATLPGERRGLAAAAWRMCREQWAITLALTPLTVLLFQQLSLAGLLANLVAIPWVTLVITPLAMTGAVVAPLWDAAARAVQILVGLLEWLAALPGSSIDLAAPPLWLAGAGMLGGALLVMRLPPALRLAGLPMLLALLLWQPQRPPPGQFEVLAVDVGQGNAVLVRTAHHTLLYDAGPRYGPHSDAGERVLVPLLRALGERLDLLVLSHRDSDHTGGAAAVLAAQPSAALLASVEAEHPLQALRPGAHCRAGQRWTWDGVQFEVLHPGESDDLPDARPNEVSCVLRIANGKATALLAGDIERQQEAALVARVPERLRADVLLVPHHGSKTSSSGSFLDAVQPRIGLVQAGYRNRFGHPAGAVAARYGAHGARLVENVRCGAALWRSARPGDVDCQRERQARYWQHRPP